MMNGQQAIQRSYSVKHRPPPPPPSLDSESLPETFISSLRQLFSILDKTKSGHVPFDVFKRYFDTSTSTIDFLNELDIESKSKDNQITFDLLVNVIKRAISSRKSPPPPPPPPPVFIPRTTRPINRSASVLIAPPKPRKKGRQIPVVYRSSTILEINHSNASNPLYYNRNNQVDFPMIRALKRFEIERNLLIQTCQTLDRVKGYLNDRLSDMKEKRKSYCHCLSTAETTGIATESMYNRDLVADLLKLANTVIEEAKSDMKAKDLFSCDVRSKKFSDHSSNSSSTSSLIGINHQLKAKDDHIKRLETEKRILLKELIEMRHEQGTVIPTKIPSLDN